MNHTIFSIKEPANEPILSYAPGTPERELLKKELQRMVNEQVEVPVVIGGKEYFTGDVGKLIMPHHHGHVLGTWHKANEELIHRAIAAALAAKKGWETMPWPERASINLRAAELLGHKYRYILNAATMLNQSKSVHQAEIDSACELVDFLRFNTYYMNVIYNEQPHSSPGTVNRLGYRPLEGFVFALSPFNFTSIADGQCGGMETGLQRCSGWALPDAVV